MTTKKSVLLKATFILEAEVPNDWDFEQIDFHFNESSWCCDNVADLLDNTIKKLNEKGMCLCQVSDFKYLGESEITDLFKTENE